MKFLVAASLLTSAFSTLAAAAPPYEYRNWELCLDYNAAKYLVDGFGSLISNYNNATANALLADDFTDTSDSINYLAGKPAGSVTFPSKLAFELGQGSQPPVGFNLLAIDAIACKSLAFRYEAILAPGAVPIKGINILYASNKDGTPTGWQIKTNYAEFNSALWSFELGQATGTASTSCPAPRA